jgi:hypothetical protein
MEQELARFEHIGSFQLLSSSWLRAKIEGVVGDKGFEPLTSRV